jgi:hypothetical protein
MSPTRQDSQYPCPKFDVTALLYNIYQAYILKQRSIGAASEMHIFPAKAGANTHCTGPHAAPHNAKFLVIFNGLGKI